MPSLFERFGRSLTRKKTDELLPKSSEKPSSAPTEPNGKHNQISTPDARPGATEFPSAQEKPNPRQKRFSRTKSPSARPVPTPRVPVLSLHLPELRDAAVAKAQRLTFEAIAEDPQFPPGAIAKRRLTPPEAVYLAKQTSGALHGKGMHPHNTPCPRSCCLPPSANIFVRCRTRHSRHLQTPLALGLARSTAQTH